MSTETPGTKPASDQTKPDDTAMTVDVEMNAAVLDAVSIRLPVVRAAERQRYGRTTTNLSTLCEEIVLSWQPGQTKTTRIKAVAKCDTCGRTVNIHTNGKLRVHGKPRCPEQYAPGGGKVETRPLRFVMNRKEYERVKALIHAHKQSVTSVLTQRLAYFARNGEL